MREEERVNASQFGISHAKLQTVFKIAELAPKTIMVSISPKP
jgi:hypothetical protein